MKSRRSMSVGRLFRAVVAVMCIAGLSNAARAQNVANSSIIGKVSDESGLVLPGVTISARSAALQAPELTTVTDERGEYRLVELPPGVYTVAYALSGFQTVRREEVRLLAGFVATLNAVLKIGTVTETVTVSGQSPLVDVTSTASRTEFLREEMEAIPTSGNSLRSLLIQAPGVRSNLDVGGSGTGSLPTIGAFGRLGQSQPMLEGILGREATGSAGGSYYDYSTFQEAQVQTLANDAEAAVPGVVFNAIVKSGGNTFHGAYAAAYETPRLQSSNIDAKLAAQGITAGNPLVKRYDTSADLGGRVVLDKLWFYGAGRKQLNNNLVIGCVKPEGEQCDQPLNLWFVTGKASYQFTSSQKLILFLQKHHKSFIGGTSTFVPWESRYDQEQPAGNGKIEWSGISQKGVVASLQYGNWNYHSGKTDFSTKTATVDLVTQQRTGEQINSYVTPGTNDNWRNDFTGSLSFYKKNWLGGDHTVKAGGEYFQEYNSNGSLGSRPGGDYLLQFQRGVAFQVVTYNVPVVPQNFVNYGGLYIKDNWSLNRRVTLNVGVRFDHYNMFIPEQTRVAGQFAAATTFKKVQFPIWNNAVPRVHIAYDVTGDAKTVIKGGWGRFNEIRQAYSEPIPFNANAITSTTWRWHDLNGDKQYEAGEVDLNPNGLDFVSNSGGTTYVVNPNEQQPQLDEYSATLERELPAKFAVRVSAVYARGFDNRRLLNTLRPYETYNIPITSVNAAHPDQTITYYDYPASLQGLAFQNFMFVNDPNYVNTWGTLDVALVRRLANRWQVQGSYTATKKNMQFVESGEQRPTAPLTPNDEIFAKDQTWDWLAKVSGSVRLPFDILASENYQLISGPPRAAQVLLTGGRQVPSVVVNAEPLGSFRLPTVHMVDFRLEKAFPIAAARLRVRADVFNLLNVNVATATNLRVGSTFNVPTAIVPPRIVQFGATYAF
jgi:carboxypeptidase family protein